MKSKDYIEIFKDSGALLEGHFILTSGKHSPSYFQCAKVLQKSNYLKLFSDKISDHFKDVQIDMVVSPAVGGIVIGTAVGMSMNKPAIFAEREQGRMTLRRGFEIKEGESVLIVEDVITTGGSVREVIELVESFGGKVKGLGIIVDRSNGTVNLHSNQLALATLSAVSYEPEDVPEELALIPIEKPGSRSLKQ